MSWGSSSMMSTPMLAAPAMAVTPNVQGGFISPSGWPRPLATQEDVDRSPPSAWDRVDDGYERRQLAPRGNTPTLSRSVSLSSSPSSASLSSRSLSRNASLRGGNAAEALKRPPREWRIDFSLSGAGFLSGLLGNRARSKSFGGNGVQEKVVLHPYIRYNASKPPMHLDLRESPNAIKFRALKDRTLNNWDLMRFVCEPPLPVMRLYHERLPWYIEVEAQNPSGVTLYELFCAIHYCMWTQIQNADYYNVEMTTEARAHVAEAWAERCRTDEERAQGIRRVDYLMGRVVMEGIQKGKDGMFEIKTRRHGSA
ncbi:hypothetical protein L226DRAFT_471616 [Lentinus tigrinus ALCF2SS1-7]|uniref:DUF6699 domain-containing protein n=1 Tax=Lentinus tigrinus ALCF2SS1-6 TaxID=1328759 RepID=A0A5C2SAF3_9APHY|nr:hypothetical protein L227DRAFT_586111 [Lentinus tigrinus ALCF2SS1-6]RPD69515.1 hypothetical protein L226DRAFT_471616 [Lentinus tigrinus ALCF2SS1-7]